MSFILRPAIAVLLLSSVSVAQAANVFGMPIEESTADAQLRFVQMHTDQEQTSLAQANYQKIVQQQLVQVFGKNQQLSVDQFLQAQQSWIDQQFDQERQSHIKQSNVRFESIDFDKEGSIDLREFQNTGLKSFDRYDTDKNGIVNQNDRGEDEQAMQGIRRADTATPQRRIKGFLAMPTTHSITGFVQLYQSNGDSLTQAEYLSHREKQFARTDTNQDGVLSAAEYESEFMQRVAQTAQKAEDALKQHFQQVFKQADQNADGQLSKREFESFKRQQFQYWDASKNGVIDGTDLSPAT